MKDLEFKIFKFICLRHLLHFFAVVSYGPEYACKQGNNNKTKALKTN